MLYCRLSRIIVGLASAKLFDSLWRLPTAIIVRSYLSFLNRILLLCQRIVFIFEIRLVFEEKFVLLEELVSSIHIWESAFITVHL